MISILFQVIFIVALLLRWEKANKCYKILVLLQAVSFALAPIVGLTVKFNTVRTFFNTIFCLVNLYLITEPWRNTKFNSIEIEDEGFFRYYKKVLYIVLDFTIVNNLMVLLIVFTHMSSIATFKALNGYQELYDSVPYFGLMFRYTEITKNFGLLALPIWVYYLKNNSLTKAKQAFLKSTATLIAAVANYSRAQILVYTIVCICFYYYTNCTLGERIKRIIKKIIKCAILVFGIGMTTITVNRFSSPTMSYYSDRIPDNSLVKSATVYSVCSYASMGFRNGIEQLELHKIDDVMYGEPVFYQLLQTLSYFHLISWDSDDYQQRLHEVYDKEGLTVGVNEINSESVFHGYTCSMIKMFGYIGTLLISILYFRYVKRKSMQRVVSIKSLTILLFLLIVSSNSIFYSECSAGLFPFLFYLIISVTYGLFHGRVRVKTRWVI